MDWRDKLPDAPVSAVILAIELLGRGPACDSRACAPARVIPFIQANRKEDLMHRLLVFSVVFHVKPHGEEYRL